MALVVQKYGGTSVGSVERIRNVARRIAKTFDAGNEVVVVVSAMSGETNRLVALAAEITEFPNDREYDVLVSTGEQVTIALLSMCLQSMGYNARSYLGSQIPMLTDKAHARARIKSIADENIRGDLKQGTIIIIAGFQGTDGDGNITTLGRGGSDTSAVAVAAALKADVCEIYTDVDGVYTTDPRMVSEARKIEKISYDEMLEMASLGAKVLQIRSVEFAKKYNVVIHVRSSFHDKQGTLVMKEDQEMETVLVSGVAFNKDEAKISIFGVPDQPGISAQIFMPLSDNNITVDMIIQNISHQGATDITFTVPKGDCKKAVEIIEKVAEKINARGVSYDTEISKVSIIGVGMRSHAGIASNMFDALSQEGINIQMISTSEIKVSCVVDAKYTELAVRVLHKTFGLDLPEIEEKL
ncbi:MAG: aspartate kinase [Thermodesulfobacteriota bacterium]|nr:aspartate kinase [Thermodesulfobacteriota bacterium]